MGNCGCSQNFSDTRLFENEKGQTTKCCQSRQRKKQHLGAKRLHLLHRCGTNWNQSSCFFWVGHAKKKLADQKAQLGWVFPASWWSWIQSRSVFLNQNNIPLMEAAETKALVPVALKISEAILDVDIEVENWILNLLRQSYLIDKILTDTASHFRLTGSAAAQFQAAIMNYNLLSSELRMAFGGEQFFNFTIKQHGLAHVALDCTEMHPRCAWHIHQRSLPENLSQKNHCHRCNICLVSSGALESLGKDFWLCRAYLWKILFFALFLLP